MKKILLLIFTVFLSLSVVYAQEEKSVDTQEPTQIMEQFFSLLEKDVEQALDFLFATNEWVRTNKEITEDLKEKFTSTRKLLGNYSGYELISRYDLGFSYRKFIYLLKYDRQPIGLVVSMYKPKNEWRLQNINFFSDFDKELEKVVTR